MVRTIHTHTLIVFLIVPAQVVNISWYQISTDSIAIWWNNTEDYEVDMLINIVYTININRIHQFLLLSITLLMYTIHQTVLYTIIILIILILVLLDYLLLIQTTLLLSYLLILLDMDHQLLLMVYSSHIITSSDANILYSQYNSYNDQ